MASVSLGGRRGIDGRGHPVPVMVIRRPLASRSPIRLRAGIDRRIDPPDGPAVGFGDGVGVVWLGESFPAPEDLAEAEAGGAEGRGDFLGERGGEGEDDGLLAFVAEAGFAGEGSPTEGGPLRDLLGLANALLEGEQGAVEGIDVEVEEPGTFRSGRPASMSLAGASLALGVPDFGFLFGEVSLLLFMGAQTFGKRAGHRCPRNLWSETP